MKINQTQIKNGWKYKTLGEIAKVITGSTPRTSHLEYYDGNIMFVSPADFNGKWIIRSEKTLTYDGFNQCRKIPKNSVLFVCIGSTIGKIGIAGDDLATNQQINAVIGRGVSSDFLYYSLLFQARKIKLMAGTQAVPIVSKSLFESVDILFPSQAEQTRIVAVLETWDKAIERLARKIEIKKKIKKGLMQRLLTGKLRLPGYSDKWQMVKLSDICKRFRTGKLDANAMVKNGKYRFYTCAKNYYRIDDYAFDTEALLVSGNGANVGYIHYYSGKFNAYQRTYVLDNFISDITFTKYILDEHLHKRIFEEKCDGNTPYIKMDTLTDMKFKIPTTKEEQLAITKIIVSADSEVGMLERKLKYLKDQKKYLLNNLITGTIRTMI